VTGERTMIEGTGIHLSRESSSSIPLEEAAQTAARRGADFFPSRVGLYSASRSQSYLRALRRSLQAGYQPSRAEIVPVPKYGGGSRPAADLRVSDRILFDALAARLSSQLSSDIINRSLVGDARTEAEDALREGPHTHVLVTDVVAFYEYVDRERLVGELLDLTGDDDLVNAMAVLLDGITADPRGIPQASPEATVLGDVYLSIADRELGRAGFEIVRWADDYRIAATDLKTAYRATALLERALRGIGLVISGAKTWTPSIEKYGEWIDDQRATRDMVQQILARIRARKAQEYAEEEDEQPRQRPRVDRSLEKDFLSATEEDAPWGSSPQGYVASRRVQVSLRELGRTGSSAPLDRLEILLFRFPHLTRDISRYLRRRIASGRVRDTVQVTATALVSHAYPFEWQAGWLTHSLIPVPTNLSAAVIQTCAERLQASDIAGFIRGRAAILLATEGQLPTGELDTIWREIPEANRDDLVAAALLVEGPDAHRFLRSVRRDPLYKAIADEGLAMDISQW
jgi:hypothetical protein